VLPYPSWLDAIDCARIDEALTRAEPPDVPADHPLYFPGVRVRTSYVSEAAAIDGVLFVAAVVVDVLSQDRPWWPEQHVRHEAAHRLVGDIIKVLAPFRSLTERLPLEPFATNARAAVERSGFWTSFVSSVPPPTVAPKLRQQQPEAPIDPTDPEPLFTLQEVADKIQKSVATLHRWNRKRLYRFVRVGPRDLRVPLSTYKQLISDPDVPKK